MICVPELFLSRAVVHRGELRLGLPANAPKELQVEIPESSISLDGRETSRSSTRSQGRPLSGQYVARYSTVRLDAIPSGTGVRTATIRVLADRARRPGKTGARAAPVLRRRTARSAPSYSSSCPGSRPNHSSRKAVVPPLGVFSPPVSFSASVLAADEHAKGKDVPVPLSTVSFTATSLSGITPGVFAAFFDHRGGLGSDGNLSATVSTTLLPGE